jgi:hypothetical protein
MIRPVSVAGTTVGWFCLRLKKSMSFDNFPLATETLTAAQRAHCKTCSRVGYKTCHVGQSSTNSCRSAAACQCMRCGVDKSREADAQALGCPTQHHRTLKSAWYEKLRPHTSGTGGHFKSSLFKRWFVPGGASVLLECSMQEGYAWDGRDR